jgi:hypothetical protein
VGGGGALPPEPEVDEPPVFWLAPGAEVGGVVPPRPAYCSEPADEPDPPNGLRLEPPPPLPPPLVPPLGTWPLVDGDDGEPDPPPEWVPGFEGVPTESTRPGKSRIVLTFRDVMAATPMAA